LNNNTSGSQKKIPLIIAVFAAIGVLAMVFFLINVNKKASFLNMKNGQMTATLLPLKSSKFPDEKY